MSDAEAVRFRSDAFSLEPTKDGDLIADLPLGDDLAAVLREQILVLRPTWWIDTPILEDWGTVLWVKVGEAEYHIQVQWLPDPEVDNRWGITFTRPRGIWRFLFGSKVSPSECLLVRDVVAEVIAADRAKFHDVQWMTQTEWQAAAE